MILDRMLVIVHGKKKPIIFQPMVPIVGKLWTAEILNPDT